MKRLIVFLVRRRLGLKKHERFQFINQRSNAFYFFTETNLVKVDGEDITKSNVSLNWLLDDNCVIVS